MNVQLRERGVYAFGPFRLDPMRRSVVDADGEVRLTPRLFDALLFLVQNSERLVTQEELASAIWTGRAVEKNNVRKAISSLRIELQRHAPAEEFIHTVPGRGVRFTVPVIFEPEVAGAPIANQSVRSGTKGAGAPQRRWQRPAVVLCGFLTLLLIVSVAALWRLPQETAAVAPFAPPPHSVAVMAFRNASGNPAEDYFSDGLSEELIKALGRIGGLKVAARQSSSTFKGKSVSIGEIARQLDVGAVLEGNVRRDGPRLRVSAQLIDARTGYQLWSRDFDRGKDDLFSVQDEIAEAVATSLRVTLLSDDVAKLTVGNTTKPAALDAYLRGMKLRSELTTDSARQALAAFDVAVKLDPDFALAHVERAATLINFVEGFGGVGNDLAAIQRFRVQAFAAAERAVSLAPRLGAAHAVLAGAEEELWQFPAAEAEYARARELAPSDATTERRYARFAAAMGHHSSAASAAQHAVQLDPLSPGAYFTLASNLTLARRPDDASVALRHAEQLGFAGLRDTDQTAQIALLKRDFAAVRQICAGEQDWVQDYYLAVAAYALGDRKEAQAALAKLRALQGDNSAFQYATIYAQWGDTEDALRWLETAYRVHDDGLIDMKTYWLLDPIRGSAGYGEVERRMNFPP